MCLTMLCIVSSSMSGVSRNCSFNDSLISKAESNSSDFSSSNCVRRSRDERRVSTSEDNSLIFSVWSLSLWSVTPSTPLAIFSVPSLIVVIASEDSASASETSSAVDKVVRISLMDSPRAIPIALEGVENDVREGGEAVLLLANSSASRRRSSRSETTASSSSDFSRSPRRVSSSDRRVSSNSAASSSGDADWASEPAAVGDFESAELGGGPAPAFPLLPISTACASFPPLTSTSNSSNENRSLSTLPPPRLDNLNSSPAMAVTCPLKAFTNFE
mmetsp:Transcript_10723/g.26461  ORF Transcript_10723/g.26461 Transcript_10723/m.26461 type:complete len:274 (-) Transcript_10723:470-1291(-)